MQEKVAKGYDIAEDVFSDDTLRLAQTITFKATNVHAGNWSLIIEEEPTIELVEFVNKKSIAPQNELFGYLSEKYSEENLHNIGKLMELLTVLIKFDVKRGKNKSLALRDGLSFIKRIIPFEYEHKFPIKFSKVGIVEEGENKGKISVIYSEEDMSDIGIYDISLLEDELRLVRDLEHHQSIKIC